MTFSTPAAVQLGGIAFRFGQAMARRKDDHQGLLDQAAQRSLARADRNDADDRPRDWAGSPEVGTVAASWERPPGDLLRRTGADRIGVGLSALGRAGALSP
jgi:hypothetical protein